MRRRSVIKGLLIMMLALFGFCAQAQDKPVISDDLRKGFEYYQAGDMKSAVTYLERALPNEEKHSDRYVLVLECLGMAYMELNDQKSISRVMALMDEHNQRELTLPCEEPGCMVERAEYYAATGENAEAKSWYLKALSLPMSKEDAYKVHASYGKFLGMTMKDYVPAADYCYAAAQIRLGMGMKDEEYAGALYSAALYFYFGDQNDKAIEAYGQVKEFFGQHLENQSARKNIALCHEGMARSYFVLQDFAAALECYKKTLDYYESEASSDEKYPKLMVHVAKCARYMNDYATAISYYEKALAVFEERGLMDDYSSAAVSLNHCYMLAGVDKTVDEKEDEKQQAMFLELDRIISEEKASLDPVRQYLGELSYARSLSTIAIDDSEVGILHIATHGVCISDDGMSSHDAMSKSFLVFAGANNGGITSADDGLVTAAEVAAMNLRDCDLAVLSACETGLGALGADGVFGLQRGFKNAGVRTLLMSLKEVYDDSTSELMIRFYRHLMGGASKREALVKAQQEIRALGYTDSIHWASFILLDAF